MKIFRLILLLMLLQHVALAQLSPVRVTAKYFRVNPLDRKFSVFVSQLLKDTAFIIDEQYKKTDTSLFYVRGHYNHFNPFLFKASEVSVVMTETLVSKDSSANIQDTVLTYQVTAITSDGPEQLQQAKAQYHFFKKKYGTDYLTNNAENLVDSSNQEVGEAIHYYATVPLYVPVVSAYYSKLQGEDKYAFTIAVRLKVKSNWADLPIPPDGF